MEAFSSSCMGSPSLSWFLQMQRVKAVLRWGASVLNFTTSQYQKSFRTIWFWCVDKNYVELTTASWSVAATQLRRAIAASVSSGGASQWWWIGNKNNGLWSKIKSFCFKHFLHFIKVSKLNQRFSELFFSTVIENTKMKSVLACP